MKFAFIRDHRSEFLVDRMCEVLEVSRSGFYRWLHEPVGRGELRDRMLLEAIVDVHETVTDPRALKRLGSTDIAAAA